MKNILNRLNTQYIILYGGQYNRATVEKYVQIYANMYRDIINYHFRLRNMILENSEEDVSEI